MNEQNTYTTIMAKLNTKGCIMKNVEQLINIISGLTSSTGQTTDGQYSVWQYEDFIWLTYVLLIQLTYNIKCLTVKMRPVHARYLMLTK